MKHVIVIKQCSQTVELLAFQKATHTHTTKLRYIMYEYISVRVHTQPSINTTKNQINEAGVHLSIAV